MNEPVPIKITVATVTFNAASLLGRTIESVENQDYPHVEHVIVDGLSHDGTSELLQNYSRRNAAAHSSHTLRIVSEPDSGLYDAMNKAIRMATGHYILFLNAGDKFHSTDTLRHIADIARSNAYGRKEELLPAVIYGNTNIVDNNGRFLRERRLTPPEHLSWKSFRNGMLVCHQAFFARTDLARQNLYRLKYRFSADYDWCIRIMRQAERDKMPLTNAHIVVADYLEGGLTTKNHRRSLMERFHIMVHHYGLPSTLCMHLYFSFRSLQK